MLFVFQWRLTTNMDSSVFISMLFVWLVASIVTLVLSKPSQPVDETVGALVFRNNLGLLNETSYVRYTAPDSVSFQNVPGSNSFTLEAFVNSTNATGPNSANINPAPFAMYGTIGPDIVNLLGIKLLYVYDNVPRTLEVYANGTAVAFNIDWPADQAFHHVAIVGYNGTSIATYIDGTRVNVSDQPYDINGAGFNTIIFQVGSIPRPDGLINTAFDGSLTNLRYNSTVALYSGPSFAVPTPVLLNVTGTVLLLDAVSDATKFNDGSIVGNTYQVTGDKISWASTSL